MSCGHRQKDALFYKARKKIEANWTLATALRNRQPSVPTLVVDLELSGVVQWLEKRTQKRAEILLNKWIIKVKKLAPTFKDYQELLSFLYFDTV